MSKQFGSSTASTTFGDNQAATKGMEAWMPLAVLGGLGFILALVLILALRK